MERSCKAIFQILFLLTGFAAWAQSEIEISGPKVVYVLTVDGVINPLTTRYLNEGIRDAVEDSAEAIILELNTPGGLESSMREMVQSILGAKVPIVVYVTPSGGRAASAGMFLVMAAHVAAMAPGTNIGAAHPVQLGGERREGEQPDPALSEKIVNDAAALARSIAHQRGRNSDWAEEAVLKSVSITAEEAQAKKVVDLVSQDRNSLLREMNGRVVATPDGSRRLSTESARLVERPMNWAERLIHVLIDPNIAYLLLSIGFIGIIAELYHPGAIFPGVIGVVSLIIAFTALGSLPMSWGGVTLLLLAFALFTAELQTQGLGIFAALGVGAFLIGSILLYRPISMPSPALPNVQVSPWVIGVMTSALAVFFALVMKEVVRSRSAPVATGEQALIGKHARVVSDFTPVGMVELEGETWSAVPEIPDQTSKLHFGDLVEVTKVEGVRLIVRIPGAGSTVSI